jgi:transposase
VYQIKKELKESNNQGWTTKQIEELIIKKSGIKYKISLYSHIPSYSSKMNLSRRRCQVKYMLILHLQRKKRLSKKGYRTDTCG